jgi:hypothetical protein
MNKKEYVLSQPQTREHHCHWLGCETQVPPAMWGCAFHWRKLPKALRDDLWEAYRPGQEIDLRPSTEYMRVAWAIRAWIINQQKAQDNQHVHK